MWVGEYALLRNWAADTADTEILLVVFPTVGIWVAARSELSTSSRNFPKDYEQDGSDDVGNKCKKKHDKTHYCFANVLRNVENWCDCL